MKQSIEMTLPMPPSTNRLWRNVGKKVILSKEYRAYKARVMPTMRNALHSGWVKTDKPLRVSVTLLKSNGVKFDIDNRFKALFDCMESVGFFFNDNQIVELSAIKKNNSKETMCIVSVEEI